MLSTGNIAEDISKVAIKHGWQTFTAWGRFAKPSVSFQIRVGCKLDTYKHFVSQKLFDGEGLASKRATRKLITQIEKIKPDIIHLHNIHGYYINIKLLFEYLQRNNLPVIWTLHDCWAFTGHCYHYPFQGRNKWLDQCYSCPLKHRYPKSLFLDQSRRNYKDKKKLFTSLSQLQIVTPSFWL